MAVIGGERCQILCLSCRGRRHGLDVGGVEPWERWYSCKLVALVGCEDWRFLGCWTSLMRLAGGWIAAGIWVVVASSHAALMGWVEWQKCGKMPQDAGSKCLISLWKGSVIRG